MPQLAQTLVTLVAGMLQDPSYVRWSSDFLLEALCDGQRDLVGLRPDAGAQANDLTLVAGIRQTLPSGAGVLIEVVRNMGEDGSNPGPMISHIKRKRLDRTNPGWPADDSSAVVDYYMYDERQPKSFLVYPPVPATPAVHVEAVYSVLPADIALVAQISVSDDFAEPLRLFMLARAYARDGEETQNLALAESYRSGYVQLLGVQDEAEAKNEPRGQK